MTVSLSDRSRRSLSDRSLTLSEGSMSLSAHRAVSQRSGLSGLLPGLSAVGGLNA